MKKNITIKKIAGMICLVVLTINNINAQIGMHTNNPDKSSALDISATNKGLLIPRINLTSLTDKTSINGGNPAISLMVYNTNSSLSGGAGYVYWDGASWKRLISETEVAANQVQADWNTTTTTDPSYIKNKPATAVGDNLGDHTATKNINLNSNTINNSPTTDNTKGLKFDTTGNGTFLQNATITDKTTSNTAQIKLGTDGNAPQPGYFAKAADANGNIIWGPMNAAGVVAPKLMAMAKSEYTNTNASGVFDIWYDTKVYDPENAMDKGLSAAAPMKYVVKKAGLHQVFLNYTNNSGTGAFWARIKKNGNVVAANDAATNSVIVFTIDNYNVGDIITVDRGGSGYGWASQLSKIAIFRFE